MAVFLGVLGTVAWATVWLVAFVAVIAWEYDTLNAWLAGATARASYELAAGLAAFVVWLTLGICSGALIVGGWLS